MPSFTVGATQKMISSPEGVRELKTSLMESPKAIQEQKEGFLEALNKAVDDVNSLQKTADVKMQELATGKTNNIPDVMMAVEKADIAMKLMVSVRNKMIEAYQEVMKMQV